MAGTVAFYKQKQIRLKGTEDHFVEAIRISPAEGKIFCYHIYNFFDRTDLLLQEISICKAFIT
jgi:hypothetical protein